MNLFFISVLEEYFPFFLLETKGESFYVILEGSVSVLKKINEDDEELESVRILRRGE